MAPGTRKPRGYVKVKVQPPVSAKRARQKITKQSPSSQKPKKLCKGNGVLKLNRFTVDCTPATDTNVMDMKNFQTFLQEHVESEMDKTGDNAGNFVVVKIKESKVTVTSGPPFTEKVLKSLTKKYLKRNQVKFKVALKGSHSYQLTKRGNSNEEEDEVAEDEK